MGDAAQDSAPTIPETFRKIVAFLEAQRVPFVLIGGLATGLQGEPRSTHDVDLMIALRSARVPSLASAARKEGFDIEPELAETQWLASGFVRFWHGPPGSQVAVDLMACNSEFLDEVAWRAQQVRFCGVVVPVATPEDLIVLKLSAWRAKDIPDVLGILGRHKDRLDIDHVRKWVSWFAARNPYFREMPRRLEAVLGGGPLPPPERG